MKTPLQSSLAGTINPLFAGVLGLIGLGTILLGWEWHAAHPGKHVSQHRAAKHAVSETAPTPGDAAAPGAAGNDGSTNSGAVPPGVVAAGKKKHHKAEPHPH